MLLRKLIFQNITWRGLYFFTLFLLNIIISRYFKASASGELYYIVNNLSFILLIASLSLESGIAYFISKKEISEKKAAWFCIFWSIAATLISLSFFNFFKPNSANNILPGKEFIIGCSNYVLGVLLTTFFTPMFFAKNNFILPNLILFFLNLLMIATLIVFNKNQFIHQHFAFIYFSTFLIQGFVIAFTYCIQNDVFKKMNFLSQYDLQKLFRYSLLALSSNIIFFLVYRVDYWFVSKNCSAIQLGNYIQASKLAQVFIMIPTTIASAVFINTASKKDQDINPLKMISRFVVLFYFLLIVLLIVIGKWLFPFIYGNTFGLMYSPFLLLAPGIIALSSLALLTAYFAGIGKVLINVKGAFYSLLITVTGYFFFTPVYGINGAAAVSSIGYMFYLFYAINCFKKEQTNTSVFDFFILQVDDINMLRQYFFGKKLK